MATTPTSRGLAHFVCRACRPQVLRSHQRAAFSAAAAARAENPSPSSTLSGLSAMLQRGREETRAQNQERSGARAARPGQRAESSNPFMNMLERSEQGVPVLSASHAHTLEAPEKPHRLHVYAHKHNTHISFVQPPTPASSMPGAAAAGNAGAGTAQQTKMVDLVLSLSTGNIGFRKGGRGSYDAAYQLAAYAFKQLAERGLLRSIGRLEVVLRGFGAGREAVTKALLGPEGRFLRTKISAVVDATRLKHGGTRSPKPRRLG